MLIHNKSYKFYLKTNPKFVLIILYLYKYKIKA